LFEGQEGIDLIALSFSLVPSYPISRYVDVVARAGRRGFDRLWVPDQGFHRDPFIALTAVGTGVDGIDLGIAVTNVFTRHPAQIARAAAALGELRPGGVVLGLGAGERRVRDAVGSADARFVEVTRDAIMAIRRLFAGESVTIKNDAFVLDGVKLEFTPTGHVAFYVASTARSAFRMAGAVADGVIIGDIADPAAMRSVIAEVHAGATEAERDPREVKIVCWTTTVCTDDRNAVFELMRRRLLPATIGTMSEFSRHLVGVDANTYNAVADAFKQRTPILAGTLGDEIVDRVALVGSAGRIAERILELEAAGVDMIGMRMPGALLGSLDFEANLERIGTEVAPTVKSAIRNQRTRHA
jgi:5,10-methylenetetrahydromethanopterin reductase